MGWIRTSLFLCVFGLLKEFRPSEPFFVDYLTSPLKNFTETEVYQDIYPVSTYSNLATLLLVLLLTDILRYKPVIIVGSLSGCCVYIIMILSKTFWGMYVAQFFYGVVWSAEVAYYAYIYAKVEKENFEAVSSHTRVAVLVGRFASSLTAQMIVSLDLLDYHQLAHLTLSGLVLATVWAFLLPSVGQSVYFHRKTEPDSSEKNRRGEIQIATIEVQMNTNEFEYSYKDVEILDESKSLSLTEKIMNAYHLLWKDFLLAYSNWYVLKWSIWWTFATCGFMQVLNYAQSLWQATSGGEEGLYNGAIDASYTILGALAAFAVGKLRLDWSKIGEAMLSILAIIQGIMILLAARTDNIWISYAVYVGFGVLYQAMITVTSAEVAKNIPEDSYGLIFGTNTLMALLLQSALTFAVSGNQGFALTIRTQYLVYGGYFIILGVLFMTMAIYSGSMRCRSAKRHITPAGTMESVLAIADSKTSIS